MQLIWPTGELVSSGHSLARDPHEKLRAAKFREIVEDGAFYGQPHSEPVEQGETDTRPVSAAGASAPPRAGWMAAMWSTDGSFSPLAGCAPYYATLPSGSATSPGSSARSISRVPKDAPGVSFPGEWDRMGRRATISRWAATIG